MSVEAPSLPERLPALRVRDFSKTFGDKRVLADVSFDVMPGSVHALLGGNGSGKSTLVKALSGVQPADVGGELTSGTSAIESQQVSPAWARRRGLRFVHQNPAIFATMTVAENLFISHGLLATAGWVRRRRLNDAGRELLTRFELDIDPNSIIGELGLADQTMVAIARALRSDSGAADDISTLVLDEPTAALPEDEVRVLLDAVRRIAGAGAAIIYITHRLEEVLLLADTVTVLRDGARVVSAPVAGLTEGDLVAHIVGRPLGEYFPSPSSSRSQSADTAMTVRHVSGGPLKDVSLSVARGEILGIAGLLGSGRSELLRAAFGDLTLGDGEVLVGDMSTSAGGPSAAIAAGVAYVPENREEESVFPELSVADNLTSADIRRHARLGFLRRGAERVDVLQAIVGYGVRAPGVTAPISTLSGGNQQKVILARWMRRSPKVLLLDEPTQGIDVGARADIYRLVRAAVDRGLAVLLVSSDFEELAELSDRVLLLTDGAISGEVSSADLDRHRLTELVLLAHIRIQDQEALA